MSYHSSDLIRAAYRGDMAHRHVSAISGVHCIQASPGYRAAANYVAEQLTDGGLQVRFLGYQADGVTLDMVGSFKLRAEAGLIDLRRSVTSV